MRLRRSALAGLVALAAGCGKPAPPPEQAGTPPPPDQEPPVATNPDSPIQYPPRLYDQKVEGDVVLRLFVDSTGRLVADSSRVAESSGYPVLDSAALSGARKLRFVPARRRGLPVATAFLQPIEFRHPEATGVVIKGRPDTTAARREVLKAAPKARLDTSNARPDTSPRPDTATVRSDTAGVRPDTTRADTTRARPDAGVGPP